MVIEAIDKTQTLLTRVRAGNNALFSAWQEACKVADDVPAWTAQMDRVERAWPRLYALWLELEAQGYGQCLYDTPKCTDPGWFCFACPSKNEEYRKVRQA